MSESKKKFTAKKSEDKPKKKTPKKEEPKKQPPKKAAAPTSLSSLKKEYFAALKAHPADATALRTQYKKDRKALRGTK